MPKFNRYDEELCEQLRMIHYGLMDSVWSPFMIKDFERDKELPINYRRSIMRERISYGLRDIVKCYDYHNNLAKQFDRLLELQNDRRDFLSTVDMIISSTLAYQIFSRDHRDHFEKDSFVSPVILEDGELSYFRSVSKSCHETIDSKSFPARLIVYDKTYNLKNRVKIFNNTVRSFTKYVQ